MNGFTVLVTVIIIKNLSMPRMVEQQLEEHTGGCISVDVAGGEKLVTNAPYGSVQTPSSTRLLFKPKGRSILRTPSEVEAIIFLRRRPSTCKETCPPASHASQFVFLDPRGV